MLTHCSHRPQCAITDNDKDLFCLAAGDDGDADEDGTDAAKRHRHSHTRGIATGTSVYISQLSGSVAAQNSIDNYEDDPVVMCMA